MEAARFSEVWVQATTLRDVITKKTTAYIRRGLNSIATCQKGVMVYEGNRPQ
jgi:hypothetical protein